jgi:hypothetical protein
MRVFETLRHLVLILPFLLASVTLGGDDFERAPIKYSESVPENCVSQLKLRIDRGEKILTYTDDGGYLSSLLKALEVPVESQMLVFSKTSLQARRISPQTPRAIYFNDDVYVGYCQSGDVLEISAADPQLGAVFYTLNQQRTESPRLERRVDNCLVCHSSSRTEGVPGHLVRSLFVDAEGQPIFSAGSRMVDHTTPLEHRWGGWYVTGKHGSQTHLGNLVARGGNVLRPIDNVQGHNVVRLNDRLTVSNYLSPHSDIVALMILEHQVLVHNRLTKANFSTRQALDDDALMQRTLDESTGRRIDSTNRRIQSTGDELVDALLMVGEAKLTAPISGTSGYAEKFMHAGMRDGRGRSLRDLDLTGRLFKHPCSYLIYSKAFDGLPRESQDYVWRRLWKILSGEDKSEKYSHLVESDRRAIMEILCETKASVPEYWRENLKVSDIASKAK